MRAERLALASRIDGRRLAQHAFEAGLAVTVGEERRPIPIGLQPRVIDDAQIARAARIAAVLSRACAKAAAWRLQHEGAAVFAALGPVERRLVEATWRERALAVARVDFLPAGETLHALEVNATIPAMQGYSDIAAASWLHAADAAHLIAANGSNAQALLDALLDLHAQRRRGRAQRIALVCRRGDAQATELAYLAQQFAAAGFEARVLHPDQLTWDGRWLRDDTAPLDIAYRHVFLSRLDAAPAPAFEAALAANAGEGTLIANRPAPHIEMKSTLARLSEAVEDARLAHAMRLDDEERDVAASTLPWTRRLDATTARIVVAEPDAFVLKRSWSYGGHDVFLGRARDEAVFRERVARSYPDVRSWQELVERCVADGRGGGYVVQRAVPREMSAQWICTPDAVREAQVVTDYAAFASVDATATWGGVARAASSDIVNIVGGGAVVPVIRRSVFERIGSRSRVA